MLHTSARGHLEGPTLEGMNNFQRQNLECWNFALAISQRTFPFL